MGLVGQNEFCSGYGKVDLSTAVLVGTIESALFLWIVKGDLSCISRSRVTGLKMATEIRMCLYTKTECKKGKEQDRG